MARLLAVADEDLRDAVFGRKVQDGFDGVLALKDFYMRTGLLGTNQVLIQDRLIAWAKIALPDVNDVQVAMEAVRLAAAPPNH